ncbi:hypothetical protein BKI52_45035 [marine bacterium AO1-C]|nr:hypothetical protein BKI52_45035 [marine bacterium AO1-C]
MKKVKFLAFTLLCCGWFGSQLVAQANTTLDKAWVSFDFRKGQTLYSFKGKEMKIVQWNRHGAAQERVVPIAKVIPAEGKKLGKIILGPMPNIGGYGVLFYKDLQTDSARFTTLSFLEKSLFDPKRPNRPKAAEKIKPEFTIGKSTMKVPLGLFRSKNHYQKTISNLPEISADITLDGYKQMVNKLLKTLRDWDKNTTNSSERLIKSSNIFELLIASGYKPSLKSIHNLHKAEYKFRNDTLIKEKMQELNRYLNGQY